MATDFEEFSSDLDAGFTKRIDELLASAIEDQARDQRMLIETLEKAQDETRRLREVIEGREENVVDTLEARLSGIATDEGVEQISEAVDARLAELRTLLERLDPWKPAMEVQRTLAQRLADAVSSLNEGLEAANTWIASALADSSTDVKESVQAAGARSFDRLVQVQGDMEALASAIDGIPDAISARLDGIPDAVSDRLEEIPQIVSARLDEIRAEAQSSAAATSRQVEQIVDAVQDRLEDNLATEQEAMSAVSRQIERLREVIESQAPVLADEVGTAVEPFAEEMRNLAARVRRSNMNSTEVAARLEAMHQSLVAYLAQRDERLEQVRDNVLTQLVEGLGQQLRRKDRVRISEALKKANQARRDRRDAEKYRRLSSSTPRESNESRVAQEMEEARVPEPPQKKTAKRRPPTPTVRSRSKGRRKPAV